MAKTAIALPEGAWNNVYIARITLWSILLPGDPLTGHVKLLAGRPVRQYPRPAAGSPWMIIPFNIGFAVIRQTRCCGKGNPLRSELNWRSRTRIDSILHVPIDVTFRRPNRTHDLAACLALSVLRTTAATPFGAISGFSVLPQMTHSDRSLRWSLFCPTETDPPMLSESTTLERESGFFRRKGETGD